jgi:hypothetical protein
MLTHMDDEPADRGVEAQLRSVRAENQQLELLPIPHAMAAERSLGVPCGFVNSKGNRCKKLGHVGLKIDGALQYDGDHALVLCEWRACFLGDGE